MAKITRKPLARGTELLPEHLEPLSDALTDAINRPSSAAQTTGITTEQMETPNAPFSMSFNFPWLESKFFHDNDDQGNKPFYMSFCLPPVQSDFVLTNSGEIAKGMPIPILESISLAFDQRDSGAPTVSYWYGTSKHKVDGSYAPTGTEHYQYTDNHSVFEANPYEGFLAFDRALALDIKVSIYEKEQTYWDIRERGDTLTIHSSNGIVDTSTALTTIKTTASHLLQTGDRVIIKDTNCTPDDINGEWEITKVDADEFTIPANVTSTHPDSGSVIPIERFDKAGVSPTREVVGLDFPATLFATPGGSPALITGLNVPLDPFKTYILAIYAPKLHDDRNVHEDGERAPLHELAIDYTTSGADSKHGSLNEAKLGYRFNEHLALLSTWVTLGFKMELRQHDLGDNAGVQDGSVTHAVQNMPNHIAGVGNANITDSAPSAAGSISADDAAVSSALSTRMRRIDRAVQDKFRGTYGEFSENHPYSHIQHDAAYEVITVPMMQGFAFNQLQPMDWRYLPYATGEKGSAYLDRRIIPLTAPLTIQHVTACLNFTGTKYPGAVTVDSADYNVPVNNTTSGVRPYVSYTEWQPSGLGQMRGGDALFDYEIGVGLINGHGADNYSYTQVAYVSFNYERESACRFSSPFLIDAVDMDLDALLKTDVDTKFSSADYQKYFEQALVSVPLYAEKSAAGSGYWTNITGSSSESKTARGNQGKPFFAGESFKYLQARGTPVGIQAATASTDAITTLAAHGLSVGDICFITGTSDGNLDNKYWLVTAVANDTRFTINTQITTDTSAYNIAGDSAAGTVTRMGINTIRSDSGSNTTADEHFIGATKGQEQYLEVRMAIKPRLSATISSAEHGTDLIVTTANHNILSGDLVYIHGIATMTDLNGNYYIAEVVNTTTIKLRELPTTVDTAGGTYDFTDESLAESLDSLAQVTWTGSDGSGTDGRVVLLGNPKDILVGYGGNFVYLTCKKHLRG